MKEKLWVSRKGGLELRGLLLEAKGALAHIQQLTRSVKRRKEKKIEKK